MDRNDLIDSIAQERTDNAEVNELEKMYYDIQYDSLSDMTDEELKQIYDYHFDDREEN